MEGLARMIHGGSWGLAPPAAAVPVPLLLRSSKFRVRRSGNLELRTSNLEPSSVLLESLSGRRFKPGAKLVLVLPTAP